MTPTKLYVGVTDGKWYNYLAAQRPDELNFWQPSGKTRFGAIQPGAMFLFKLHSPDNYIAGGGFFANHSLLPMSLAWEAFGDKNGTTDFRSFAAAIAQYRHKRGEETAHDPTIGCIILASPFFFPRADWIPIPQDWSSNIVQGKTYDTDTPAGLHFYQDVTERLRRAAAAPADAPLFTAAEGRARFGQPQLVTPRLGQGAFKVMVTDAYHRRCAVTGEKTVPVLEAAHIRPYSQEGPHQTANGVLLRRDLHSLFDRGYITIRPDLHLTVSPRIKAEFGNGREYYALDGHGLVVMPDQLRDRPNPEFLQWHNENVYVG